HAAVGATACSACHNGSFVSQGTSGAQTKSATHVPTTADCSTCHKKTTDWLGATFAHATTHTNCTSCHNGTTPTGLTTPPPLPTAAPQPSNSHATTAGNVTHS